MDGSDNKPLRGASGAMSASPVVTQMRVIPVAGRDSMLLNLAGAHGPYFIRNVVVLKDNAGRTGIGEVPGGAGILRALENSVERVVGSEVGRYNRTLNAVREAIAGKRASGTPAPGHLRGGGRGAASSRTRSTCASTT